MNALDPHGPGARTVATIWWILLAIAVVVFVVVLALIVTALVRRPDDGPGPARVGGLSDNAFITIGGAVVPFVILVFVGVVTVRGIAARGDEAPGEPLRIEVEGADWFWNVRYPAEGVVTANEIHVPVGRPVEATLTTRDVIHSFWVPELAPKLDNIPGQPNLLRFAAERPGVYRGQCAEFCGLQHANMVFFVIAESPADYDAWLGSQRSPAPPAPGDAARGREIFEQSSCAGCHTVRGTPAAGTAGPDLTDIGRRRTLGAGAVDNTPGNLARFIARSQSVKPGNAMPDLDLPPAEVDALVAYLEGLR